MNRPTFKELELWTAIFMAGIGLTLALLIVAPVGLRHRIVDIGDYLKNERSVVGLQQSPAPAPERRQKELERGVLPPERTPKSLERTPKSLEDMIMEDDSYDKNGMMLPDLELEPEYSDIEKLRQLDMLFTDEEIEALITIESNGDLHLIGDSGNAFGCLQIWQIYADDVNETFGTFIQAPDLLGKRELSILVCNAYMHRYGKKLSFEDRARVHNKGPAAKVAGHVQRKKSDKYWEKIQKHLAKL